MIQRRDQRAGVRSSTGTSPSGVRISVPATKHGTEWTVTMPVSVWPTPSLTVRWLRLGVPVAPEWWVPSALASHPDRWAGDGLARHHVNAVDLGDHQTAARMNIIAAR